MDTKTDALTEWASKKPGAAWDYPNVEGKDVDPKVMRGYNLARHHVAALLKAEREADEVVRRKVEKERVARRRTQPERCPHKTRRGQCGDYKGHEGEHSLLIATVFQKGKR